MICTTTLDSANSNMGENSPEIINLLSDLEEGELEELSDVSSDEELLLRQRIEILENFNSVLEKKFQRGQSLCKETNNLSRKKDRLHKVKRFHKKKKNATFKVHASKRHKRKKKNVSSDSDIEEINKKKILREAVGIGEKKINPTSLKNRLFPFIKSNDEKNCNNPQQENDSIDKEEANKSDSFEKNLETNDSSAVNVGLVGNENGSNTNPDQNNKQPIESNLVDFKEVECHHEMEKYVSEDDAELLRELALNSKAKRKDLISEVVIEDVKVDKENSTEDIKNSDDSDSDIAELRIIALRSAILKKAMERKRQRKESRRKRNSKRFRRFSNVLSDLEDIANINNSTDIEEVDMDVDPDTYQNSQCNIYYDQALDPTQRTSLDDQQKYANLCPDNQVYQNIYNDLQYYDSNNYILQPIKQSDTCNINNFQEPQPKHEDLEEDEDVLRAKLLNSISSINSKTVADTITSFPTTSQVSVPKYDDSNLIIRLGDSDSESDCEETKQLIKTNQKILKETMFQRNLDLFLKAARSKVENALLSTPKNTIVTSPTIKKHTPLAVKHLPAADQQEYRQLLKRMSELQKVKMAKQQQAMIKSIASKDDDRTISVTTPEIPKVKTSNSKEEVKETNALSGNTNILNNKVADNNQETGKQQKLTKTLELHLDLTRKKIMNYSKTVKRLDVESKSLKTKYTDLKVQAQEIEIALRSTRNKLSENQRQSNTAHKNLSKLQKHEEILRNKIKNLSIDLNRNLKGNVNQTTNTYSTKIMLKNKVINKKTNVHKNNVGLQNSTVTRNDRVVKPLSKTTENSTALTKKVNTTNKHGRTVPSDNEIKQLGTDNRFVNISKKQLLMSKSVKENLAVTIKCKDESKSTDTKKSENIKYKAESNNLIIEKDLNSKKDSELENNDRNKLNPILDLNNASHNSDINKKEFTLISIADNCEISTNILSNSCDNSSTKNQPERDLGIVEKELKKTEGEAMNLKDITLCDGYIEESSNLDTVINENEVPLLNHSHSFKCLKIHSKNINAGSLEYKSPLLALRDLNTQVEDVQAIFCPFEVGGSCKDPECKYLHPKSS